VLAEVLTEVEAEVEAVVDAVVERLDVAVVVTDDVALAL
jgi:hypothetical protein